LKVIEGPGPDAPEEGSAGGARLQPGVTRLALAITRKCQARCVHCAGGASPHGGHGLMTREDWLSVLDRAADLGVEAIRFAGGEPTLHPAVTDLIGRALYLGMRVEVHTNLIRVGGALWPVLGRRGVMLDVALFADQSTDQDVDQGVVVRHRSAHPRTVANIQRALAGGIPLRVDLLDAREERAQEATAALHALGVRQIRHVRGGTGTSAVAAAAFCEVCEVRGRCDRGQAAISPDGTVSGCQMTQGLDGANADIARTAPLVTVLTGKQARGLNADAQTTTETAMKAAAVPRQRSGSGDAPAKS
jgi:hypothetical protein